MADDLHAEVLSAARITARRWQGVIDADDAEQEIWVRLLESDYIDRLSDMDKPARGYVLRRIGHQVAGRYRDDYEVFSGQVFYSTDEVRALLAKGLLDRPPDELDTASDTMSEWLDLHEATEQLRDQHPSHADIIAARYVVGDYEPGPAGGKPLTLAVDALTREMNRIHRRRWAPHEDGPGSRRAVSNAAARGAVSNT